MLPTKIGKPHPSVSKIASKPFSVQKSDGIDCFRKLNVWSSSKTSS